MVATWAGVAVASVRMSEAAMLLTSALGWTRTAARTFFRTGFVTELLVP